LPLCSKLISKNFYFYVSNLAISCVKGILQHPQCRIINRSPLTLLEDDEGKSDKLSSPSNNSQKIAMLWHSPSPSIKRGGKIPRGIRTPPPISISGYNYFELATTVLND